MNNNVQKVCDFLKLKGITVKVQNEWLYSCAECFLSQSDNVVQTDLNNFVYEQWLLADLTDVNAGTLPIIDSNLNKFILEGTYAVQLNYVINIAESFHKQLHKIRAPTSLRNCAFDGGYEVEESIGKRTLKIEITDGNIIVQAFEYTAMNKLSDTILPGVKALLIGPILCRKGILFLNNENLKLLGGEVDTFHIPNALENILARELNQRENPNPYFADVKNTSTDEIALNNFLDDCHDDDFLMIDDSKSVGLNDLSNSKQFHNIPENVETSNFQNLTNTEKKIKLSDNSTTNEHEVLNEEISEPQTSQIKQIKFPTNFPFTELRYAKVLRCTQKLKIRNENWEFAAMVNIKDSEPMELEFSFQVLNKLLNIQAKDILNRKKEIQDNPGLKETLNEMLRNSQKKIMSLEGTMKIEFKDSSSKPTVIDILEVRNEMENS